MHVNPSRNLHNNYQEARLVVEMPEVVHVVPILALFKPLSLGCLLCSLHNIVLDLLCTFIAT